MVVLEGREYVILDITGYLFLHGSQPRTGSVQRAGLQRTLCLPAMRAVASDPCADTDDPALQKHLKMSYACVTTPLFSVGYV